ncbi:tyrosine-type recombinase/integrase [Methylobacterium sp. M6A4_1b]
MASAALDTAAKRGKLAVNRNPYWNGIAGGRGGVSLGYRTPGKKGGGSWVAKVVLDGKRDEAKIAEADDDGARAGALSYAKAKAATLAWAEMRVKEWDAAEAAAIVEAAPTVRSAIEAYTKARKKRHATAGRAAEYSLNRRVLTDETFSAVPLAKLTAAVIKTWKDGLPEKLATTTVNRILNDVRAALNAAYEVHRAMLPGNIPAEIKAGTKRTPVSTTARKQIFSDADIRRIVDAAYIVDDTGDFGALVLAAAATGARFSQLARVTVSGLQVAQQRLMVPTTKKGTGDKKVQFIAVPVAPDVIERLEPLARGRHGHEPLLLRWAFKRKGVGRGRGWEKDARQPWAFAYEGYEAWEEVLKTAGMPDDTVMLCLRHSSIVRKLTAGLPVRLVAALHDTSVEMIEQHYSAYIVDATEDLIRRTLTALAPAPVARLNVVAATA